MQRRKKYLKKGNVELEPKANTLDKILYEYDDSQSKIYVNLRNDLKEEIASNILLGGVRGCGKSSLLNLAVDHEKSLIIKIDCSLADEIADLLTLIVFEISKALDLEENHIDYKVTKDLTRLIREITYSSTNVYKSTYVESIQGMTESISDFVAGVCMPLNFISFKSSIQTRLRKALESKKEKSEDLLQQRANAYFERKTAFGTLIDILNKAINKKLVIVFDEIDKHNLDFLDGIFHKYKSFLTSGKSTNVFLVSIPQYYNIICGNACDNIATYFDKKYFLRSATFTLFKNVSYNEICSSNDLELNYYQNQGIFRNMHTDVDCSIRNISQLLRAKYYLTLVEFVDSYDEFDDFMKEIIVSVLNKILKFGFVENKLNLCNLDRYCADEFSTYKNIQLEELILHILKSHAINSECWIILKEDEIRIDSSLFKKAYEKELYINSARSWGNYNKNEELSVSKMQYNYDHILKLINEGQIVLRNYSEFDFLMVDDSEHSHEEVIKTLLFDRTICSFICVKKKNPLGFEFGYLFFIDSSIKGRYVLYYDNVCWSYENFNFKAKVDNFIFANRINEIEVEVDSNFIVCKANLQHIVEKFNEHDNVVKDWIGLKW